MGPIWVRVARLFYETVGVSFHLQNSAMTAGRIRRGRRMAASGCLLPQGLVQQGYSPRFSFVFPKGKRGCICPAISMAEIPASNGTHPPEVSMDRLHENRIHTGTVESYSSEGLGIVRLDGAVVFVPQAVRGETIDLKITKVMKTAAAGEIVKIHKPSPDRAQPECPDYGRCGGCDFQHLTYPEELWAKRQRVQDALSRLGGADIRVEEILGASRIPMEQREASRKMGSRFTKTICKLPQENIPMEKREIFEEYLEARRGKPVSHCCAYGVFCAAMGIEEEETLYHYLYAQTSAMVTNCVKTIPLSQSAGQKLLCGCYEEFENILSYISGCTEDDLCLSAPGFDIRGIQHEKLYSRLYMS